MKWLKLRVYSRVTLASTENLRPYLTQRLHVLEKEKGSGNIASHWEQDIGEVSWKTFAGVLHILSSREHSTPLKQLNSRAQVELHYFNINSSIGGRVKSHSAVFSFSRTNYPEPSQNKIDIWIISSYSAALLHGVKGFKIYPVATETPAE